jgi:ferredoxin-NADP reductase
MDNNGAERYIVRENVAEAPAVVTLRLAREDGAAHRFVPGQFVTVYFPELGTPQGKAYSISSTPDETELAITIKRIGTFSNRLCDMVPGDTLTASSPYGYFYSDSSDTTLVMAAGGIGITPFRAIILHALQKTPARKLILFYSARTATDFAFKHLLDECKEKYPACRIEYFVTRETPAPEGAHIGRMSAEALAAAGGGDTAAEFMLCGSIPFVRDLWRGLRAAGVGEDRIYTEAFFSH